MSAVAGSTAGERSSTSLHCAIYARYILFTYVFMYIYIYTYIYVYIYIYTYIYAYIYIYTYLTRIKG